MTAASVDSRDGPPLDLEPLAGGRATRLRVRAQPGARRCGLAGTWNRHLRVALRSPPEGGRANAELLELLARLLQLKRAQVRLLRGQRGRLKELALDAPPALVRERLLPLLDVDR